MDCPNLGPCTSETVLEGEFCPTCLDCGNRGNGESWMETPCQRCTCLVGKNYLNLNILYFFYREAISLLNLYAINVKKLSLLSLSSDS